MAPGARHFFSGMAKLAGETTPVVEGVLPSSVVAEESAGLPIVAEKRRLQGEVYQGLRARTVRGDINAAPRCLTSSGHLRENANRSIDPQAPAAGFFALTRMSTGWL